MTTLAPSPPPKPWPAWAGRIGLYALLLSYQLNATVAYIGLGLAVLAFAFQAKDWAPVLKRDPAAKLALALALCIGLYAGWAAHEFPATAGEQQSAALAWIYGLLFAPVAWQIHQNRSQLGWLLLALAAGLLTRILLHADWGQIAGIARWPRTGFGLVETVFAPLAGLTALGWMMLAPRLAAAPPATPGWLRGLRLAASLAGLALLLEALVLAQTRGVWLAAALVFPAALLARYAAWLNPRAMGSAKGLAVFVLIAAAGGWFIQLNSAALSGRTTAAGQAAADAAAKSVSFRLEMWRLGLEKWRERPLLGWGPGTTEMLMKQSGAGLVEPDGGKPYYHLHSHYVEILARFGLAGAALFAALALLLAGGVWRGWWQGRIPRDYACFLLAGWGFWALAAAFDFQLFKFAWRNGCLVWLALSHAARLETLNPDHEDA